jgi:hypothetical protein
MKNLLLNFENKQDDDKFNHYLQKEENDNFQKEINRTLNFEQYKAKKKNPYNGENAKRDEAFREIITKYKQKGLKIPDLSTEKNLFKPSALLLENNDLKNYFKIKNQIKTQKGSKEKEIFFISKVNNLMYNRLQELDSRVDPSKFKDVGSYQKKDITRLTEFDNSEFNTYKDKNLPELKKNVATLLMENEMLKDIIKTNDNNNNNNDLLDDNENEVKIRKCISPTRRKKNRISYFDFLRSISKPKKSNIFKVDKNIKNDFNITNIIDNIIGNDNPFKPILQENGQIVKNGDPYHSYLKNLKEKIKRKSNGSLNISDLVNLGFGNANLNGNLNEKFNNTKNILFTDKNKEAKFRKVKIKINKKNNIKKQILIFV